MTTAAISVEIAVEAEAKTLLLAIDELSALMDGAPLELDGDLLSPDLRQFFVEHFAGLGFDATKLVRVHSDSTASRAGNVLVSLEPSDLFLELLSALRAGHRNVHGVQADLHGDSLVVGLMT